MADSFDAPRRVSTFPRQPEELHIPAANNPAAASNGLQPNQPPYPPQPQPEYSTTLPPSINIQQSGQQSSQVPSNSNTVNALPGALQPGNVNRPGPLPSSNTSPAVPTLPQLSAQSQPATTPSKSGSQTRGYSRSSPAGFEQQQAHRHAGHTPDDGKYGSPGALGYASQTPQTTPYSPLGLADIRPLMERGDEPVGPMGHLDNGNMQYPTNSNYPAPWGVYALDWCKWPTRANSPSVGKVALGSYLEDHHNYIHILHAQRAQSDREHSEPESDPGLEFVKTAEATHSYPVTRILWEPPSSQKQGSDLLATSGDHLRLWSLPSESSLPQYHNNSINRGSSKSSPVQKLSPLALLSNSKTPEHTAPITSLDWNVVSPSLIITSSIDTTCTIWDIPTLTAKTQLIAHDKEVFDVRFCANSVDVFVSCGADGSVRMFDLRSLEHSTIIYEPSEKNEKRPSSGNASPTSHGHSSPPPLLRIATSPHDAYLLGTFAQDSNTIRILDVRQPGQALLELKGHSAPVNCIEWSPTHRGTLASGADDSLVLVWDLVNQSNAAPLPSQTTAPLPPPPQPQQHHPGGHGGSAAPPTMERGPAAAWQCDYEVSNISWAPHLPGGHSTENWLGVCGGRGLWGVSI